MANQNGGTAADPNQRAEAPGQPQDQQKETTPKEGEFRNVETGVNSPGQFNDDYESAQEDKISEEEARTEKEGSTGKS